MIRKIIILYVLLIPVFSSCIQERIMFHPQKLAKDYQFQYQHPFQEKFIKVDKRVFIHGLLFKTDHPKGLIFYAHGNSGSLATLAWVSDLYLKCGYDVFAFDYRGFGKSDGKIRSQKKLFNDLQTLYDTLKKSYSEDRIIIMGFSIGTGPAAHLAMMNNPKMLILNAPYYSIADLIHQNKTPFPGWMLRFKLKTYEFVSKTKAPIAIFHGENDDVVYYGSSAKLSSLLKNTDSFITLKGQTHRRIEDNPAYRLKIQELLSQ